VKTNQVHPIMNTPRVSAMSLTVGRTVLLMILSLGGWSGVAFAAFTVMTTANGLELAVSAGSSESVHWPAATVKALPGRPQTLVLNLKTRTLHTLTRTIGDGEIPLAKLEASDTAIIHVENLAPRLPATRIPKSLGKLARGEPLKVAALGTSLVAAGWADEGWLRLLFGMGTPETRYLVGKTNSQGTGMVALSRYALGGSNSHYTFGLLGDALAGEGKPRLQSPIYDNDLIIVGLLPNDGVDRLALFEGVVRKLRARGIEVLLVTDEAFARKGEANQLWRDGYFIRTMADRYGCALADTAAYMREAELRGETVYKDAIHANQAGYRLWAQAIGSVLSPGFDPSSAFGLAESVEAAGGTTLQDAELVPDGAVVDFMPRNSGGVLVTAVPDNRFLKVFNAPNGGVWKIGEGASIALDDHAFMALDLLIDSSSEFTGELRDKEGHKIKELTHSAGRGAGLRATVLTALSASALKDADEAPTSLVVTSGELRLYGVIYQTRKPTP
jgi:hypothetical protein